MKPEIVRLIITTWCLLLMSACTTISPRVNQATNVEPEIFSHHQFDSVLQQTVNQQGQVDYPSLQAQGDELEAYYQLISQYSPDSHPELFPTEQDRLAYWINAYNAAVIKIVLKYYPIDGIEDVKPPSALFFLSDKTGFFFFQRPSFGGVNTSLYYLENSVIRKRFAEPRVHFALNCASRGCPKLPDYAFNGNQLEQQLQHEARKFFSEPRNLKIDPENKTIWMSSIMDWYEDDFIDWYESRYPGHEASLINYVALFLPEQQAQLLTSHAADFEVQFIAYDWTLNDQEQTK